MLGRNCPSRHITIHFLHEQSQTTLELVIHFVSQYIKSDHSSDVLMISGTDECIWTSRDPMHRHEFEIRIAWQKLWPWDILYSSLIDATQPYSLSNCTRSPVSLRTYKPCISVLFSDIPRPTQPWTVWTLPEPVRVNRVSRHQPRPIRDTWDYLPRRPTLIVPNRWFWHRNNTFNHKNI